MIDEAQALDALAALAQPTRLQIVRTLVVAGREGLAAGAISDLVGTSPSGTSFHLAQLERSGLIQSRRVARSVIYSARFDSLAGLVAFLMQDCCQGHPDICRPAAKLAAASGRRDARRGA